MAPGTYRNIPFEKYCEWPQPSQSVLKRALISPAHLDASITRAYCLKPTDDMVFGSAAHYCLLEPALLLSKVAVFSGKVRRGKEWDEFRRENVGRTILTNQQFCDLESFQTAVRRNRMAREIMATVEETELSIVGNVEGVEVKGRIDALSKDTVWDIKTARSCDRFAFAKSAYSLGYDIQAALYSQLCGGKRFGFIVIENDAPYDVAILMPDDGFMKSGRDRLSVCLQVYQEGIATGHWPGRYTEPQPLSVPEWAQADIADELKIDGEAAYA